jgi:hypothetical protein
MRARALARAGILAGTTLTAALGVAGLAQARTATATAMSVAAPDSVTRVLPAAMPEEMVMPDHTGFVTQDRCECCPPSDCACCTGNPAGAAVCRCCCGDGDAVTGAARHTADHRVGCCPTTCVCECTCGACGGEASA